MDYPCGKFGDCSFSRFYFIVRLVGLVVYIYIYIYINERKYVCARNELHCNVS